MAPKEVYELNSNCSDNIEKIFVWQLGILIVYLITDE